MLNNDLRHFIINDIGCICCAKFGVIGQLCERHHMLTTGYHGNGKRRGERQSVGLCSYHHQGAKSVGSDRAKQLRQIVGPSFADEAREFRAVFGRDGELLALQDELIEKWRLGTLGA